MTRIRTMTIATTSRTWIKPPIVYDVTTPRNHSANATAKIVENMLTSAACYALAGESCVPLCTPGVIVTCVSSSYG